MTAADDQPTRKMPPTPAATPTPSPAPATAREPVADPWKPDADPGPDEQRTWKASASPQSVPTVPTADAQRALSETVAVTPKAPETVLISPKPAPPRSPDPDVTQSPDIAGLPTPPVAETPTAGSVFDQPTAFQPPVGQSAGQVTIYPRTDQRPAPAPTRPLIGPAAGEVLRFGPGVPPRAGPDMSRAASIWRGEQRPEPDADRSRGGRGPARWILPLLVLLAVLALLLWRTSGGASIAVTGVSVHAGRQTLACDSTETVTGVLNTNGEDGTVTYRWQRSDGTTSGTLQQHIAKGTHQSEVTLLWTFNGKGSMSATATLEVLSPGPQAASAGFAYSCR